MPFISRLTVLKLGSVSTLALAVCAAGGAHAASDTATGVVTTAAADQIAAPEVQQIVVTASKGKAERVAPVTSSLTATEPEAIITRKFIEEAAPRVGDYTTTVILSPSTATTPNPNGPGATDGAKLSLRGFTDGQFNVTYDGIAWGDTNGPSHHSNSFFPSSVIGGIVIDRGPGRASDLGQANFGGQVNLFSLPLEDRLGFQQTATIASYGTLQDRLCKNQRRGASRPHTPANLPLKFGSGGRDVGIRRKAGACRLTINPWWLARENQAARPFRQSDERANQAPARQPKRSRRHGGARRPAWGRR